MSVRSLAIGCAALAAIVLVPSPALARSREVPDRAAECAVPQAERTYTTKIIRYAMSIDLSGCSWWDGTPIQMSASIDRVVLGSGDGAGSGTACGVSARPGRGNPKCSVEVTVDHRRAETARYEGWITYPGPEGDTTVSFSAVCVSTLVLARCVDLGED